MKTATIQELKQELHNTPPGPLLELCLRLAKFKKENKELLTYLLFEAHDPEGYIQSVKEIIDADFAELPKSTPYHTKKGLRKTLRTINKYIRYTGDTQTEAALLIYFCTNMQKSIPFRKNTMLLNLYQVQLKKCQTAISGLHEDLQFDFNQELKVLTAAK